MCRLFFFFFDKKKILVFTFQRKKKKKKFDCLCHYGVIELNKFTEIYSTFSIVRMLWRIDSKLYIFFYDDKKDGGVPNTLVYCAHEIFSFYNSDTLVYGIQTIRIYYGGNKYTKKNQFVLSKDQ